MKKSMLVKYHKHRKGSEELLNELKVNSLNNLLTIKIQDCKTILSFLDFKNRPFKQNNKTSIELY